MKDSEDFEEQNLALIREKARKFQDQRRELFEMKKQIEELNDQLKTANDDKGNLTKDRDYHKQQMERWRANSTEWRNLYEADLPYIRKLQKRVKDAENEKKKGISLTKERDSYKQEVQAKRHKIEELEKSLNDAKAEIKSLQEESEKAQLKSAKRTREALEGFDEPLDEADALQPKRIKTD